ncbi:MAG TPA: site-specific DNA-methyltransferase [Candidatus Lokiarchaeia archaeon]|nr:site-specific DNA-methyltransferase [Candidatus Lokiarchaeia archaeon]
MPFRVYCEDFHCHSSSLRILSQFPHINFEKIGKNLDGLSLKYTGMLVWHKTNPAPKIRKSRYLSSTEIVLFMVQGAPPFHFLDHKKMHNFIETPICMGPDRLKDRHPRADGDTPNLHPTQKPLKIYEWLIAVSSDPGSVVLDPFAGTGTANEACLNLDRHCLGIEMNPAYHAAALRRLHDASKR